MKKSGKYQSEAMGVIHRSVSGLHRIGAVDDATMRHFDEGCLVPTEAFGPAEVKALREREGASQAELAEHLGVAASTVGEWERGRRRPGGPGAKLLALAKANGLKSIA